MKYDQQKVDEVVLALLYLYAQQNRDKSTGREIDSGTLSRLFQHGLISDPKKGHKFTFTEEGREFASELCDRYFTDSEEEEVEDSDDGQDDSDLTQSPDIYFINRLSVVIKAKQPYLQWIKGLGIPDLELNLETLRKESTSLLLPQIQDEKAIQKYLETIFEDLFEMELAAWSQDEESWPDPLTWQLFNKWFDIEIHSMVLDTTENELKREPFL